MGGRRPRARHPRLDGFYVFTGLTGQVLHVYVLVTCFKRLIREAGSPDLRFHDLRHTSATLLIGLGVHSKIVQQRLGYAVIAMTLNRYSHVMPDMLRMVADVPNGAFRVSGEADRCDGRGD